MKSPDIYGTSKNPRSEKGHSKTDDADQRKGKSLDAAAMEQLWKEKKCLEHRKPWKPGHKCEHGAKEEHQAAILQIEHICGSCDILNDAGQPVDADATLLALFGYDDHKMDTRLLSDVTESQRTRNLTLKALCVSPEDATELLYTPLQINGVEEWAVVE